MRDTGIVDEDRDGAKLVLPLLKKAYPRLRLIWADGGYAGELVTWVAALTGWVLEIVKRAEGVSGFVVRKWHRQYKQNTGPSVERAAF